MKKSEKQKKIKLNLTLDEDFYKKLEAEASSEFMRITTYTKWLLHRRLREMNKQEKNVKQNEYSI